MDETDPRMNVTRADAAAGPGLPAIFRTFGGMTGLVVLANFAGGVVIGALLVALNASSSEQQRLIIGGIGAAYGVLAIGIGAGLGFTLQRRTLRWYARGRLPSRAEALRALRGPLQLAVVTGALWGVGAVLIGVLALSLGVGPSRTIGLAGGLILAGLTTAGVTYTIATTLGRPVAMIALSVYPPTEAMVFTLRRRMLLNWLLATGLPVLGIVLILAAPPGRSHIRGAALVTALVTLGVGALAASNLARTIGGRLRTVAGVLDQVGRGELDCGVEVDDIGEIGLTQRGVNEMIAGLRERERIQDLFGRHVGPAVAAEAIVSGADLGGGEQREVVALFVDITGSTRLTRRTEPAEFVAILNRFFGRVVDAVERNGGLVNKFEGDAALCVFGAPVELDDPATAALRAARAIRDAVTEDGEVDAGIGVATGPVIAGNIGAASRLEYTVIGDAVNEAARLTELAKRVDGRILASGPTLDAADDEEREQWAKGRILRLRGRDAPTNTYRTAAKVGAR